MNRRTFLATSTALVALAPMAFAAGTTVDYEEGVIEAALAEGKTVFVDFAADWCSTCRRQERIIQELRTENPAYEDMVFVRVDWDLYGNAPVVVERNIPRRSTLIVLRGQEELGRIVAGTSTSDIRALMDKGINAGA